MKRTVHYLRRNDQHVACGLNINHCDWNEDTWRGVTCEACRRKYRKVIPKQKPAPHDDAVREAPADKDSSEIYIEIALERNRQDAQWGGPIHDDEHTIREWAGFIERQAHKMWLKPTFSEARERLIKIAALAVAGVESLERRAALLVQPEEKER